MKKSKIDLKEIYNEFQMEILKGITKLNELLDKFMDNKLDKVELDEVIKCEKHADRLKEKYIEFLFKKKRLLPFLMEDRYKIVISLDRIMNQGELIARTLKIYPFKFNQNIKKEFKDLNFLFLKTVDALIKCTTYIEIDFKKAREYTIEIASLRRKAYDLKYDLLDKLYKKMENTLEIILLSDLISQIYEVISISEQMSDFLNGLIIKYPSR